MEREVLYITLSGVKVPVRGWRCPVCRTEHILAPDADAALRYANQIVKA